MVQTNARLVVFTLLAIASPFAVKAITLVEALEHVYKSNPEIQQSLQNVTKAEATLKTARAGFIPDITTTGSYNKTVKDQQGADEENHTRNLTISARQNLFSGGNTTYGLRAAKTGLTSAKATHDAVSQNILLNTVRAYSNLLTNSKVETLQQNQVNVLQEQLNATKAQFKQGEVTKTDVKQSEARLASAKAEHIQAKGNKQTSKATLDRLLGQHANNLSWPEKLPEAVESLSVALEEAMNKHPQVISSLATLTQTRYQKIQAQSAHYPSIDAVASHAMIDMDDTKGYRNNTIGVEMTWSLFTGGATQAAVQTATANKVDAENAYEQARRTIKENLTQAFHDHQTALAVLESRNAEERAALSAEIGVEKEHKLGERTVIELLNAKQELLKARVNRAKAQGEITITSYALLAAMGNLRIESEK